MEYLNADTCNLDTAEDSREHDDALDSLGDDGLVDKKRKETARRCPGRKDHIPLLT